MLSDSCLNNSNICFQTVNNKPFETSKREYWCQDGAETDDADDFSCRIQYDITTGERIWDSQVCMESNCTLG
jgi:hypothetical protein